MEKIEPEPGSGESRPRPDVEEIVDRIAGLVGELRRALEREAPRQASDAPEPAGAEET